MLLTDVLKQSVQLQALFRVQASSWLIQTKKLRTSTHGTGNFQTALITVGKISRRCISAINQIDPLQPVFGCLNRIHIGLLVAAQTEQTTNRPVGSNHQRIVLCHHQVFQNGHTAKQTDILEGTGNFRLSRNLEVRLALQKMLFSVGAVHHQTTFSRLIEPGDAVKHCGFTRTVRSDKRSNITAPNIEAQVANSGQTAKAHGQVFDLQNRVVVPGAHPWPS